MRFCTTVSVVFLFLFSSCQDDENPAIPCLPANVQGNVLAFYPFTNGSLLDYSTNENHLMNTTNAESTLDREGNLDCSFSFNNKGQDEEFLITQNSEFLDKLEAFSISIWFQSTDSSRDPGSYEVLMSRGRDRRCPDRRGEWSIGLYDFGIPVFGHNNAVWVNEVPNINEWYHLVAVKESDQMRIYLNGSLRGQIDGLAICTNSHLAQDIGDLIIGRLFTGHIDDVAIFNVALDDDEIMQISTMPPCCQ